MKISPHSIRNGASRPKYWYAAPPKGGPTDSPSPNPPKAKPIAYCLSFSSSYVSARIVIPATKKKKKNNQAI